MSPRIYLISFFLLISLESTAWGFFGHRLINRKAVFTLPDEMFGFYKANLHYLEFHAIDPDKRRYAVEGEDVKHYIDLDVHLKGGELSIAAIDSILPFYWPKNIDSLTRDSISIHGILPWNLSFMVFLLTEAFRTGDLEGILRLSAEIGHYAADAHVPLHTTANYNGQLSGQYGIHALWESRVVEVMAEEIELYSGRAMYLEFVQKSIWETIFQSHASVKKVLRDEKQIRDINERWMYEIESSERSSKEVFSSRYVRHYAELTGDLVEARLVASVQFVGSLWYTAWVNAGQPALPKWDETGRRIDIIDLSIPSEEPEHRH